jgi:hypothetical protein
MDFLYISSLGATYQYAVKIIQNLRQKTRQFGSGNPSQQKQGKGNTNRHNKGQRKYGHPKENQSKRKINKDDGKTKKDTGKWCDFHKSP